MRWALVAAVLLLLSGSACGWSSFRSDPMNTGSAPFDTGDNIGLLWEHKAGSAVTTSIVADSGRVIYGTKDGYVECIDASNGTLIWSNNTGDRLTSTPCIDGDLVIYCNIDGRIGALRTEDGEAVWANEPLGAEVHSSPKVANGRIYVGTYGSEFLCLSRDNGSVMWRYLGCTSWIHTTPSIWQNRVYFGSCDGTMNCLDASSGESIWRFNATYIPSSPSVFSGRLYFGAYDRTFYCLDATSGKKQFGTVLGDDIYSSPAVSGEGVFVGCDDGRLYKLDPFTGIELWNITSAGDNLQSSPALGGTLLAFTDREGIRIVRSDNGSGYSSYRFGDASDTSPALYGDAFIWGDSLGYVRAVGTIGPSDCDGADRSDAMLIFLISAAGINFAFFAVILIVLRLLRKRFNRTRRLRLEQEFRGGR
jgi:outer membrane protein assembly factor BamB